MLRAIIFCTLVCVLESTYGQESVGLSQFKKELSSGSKIKVINFWATWCAPCVKELPFFEKLNQENKEVEVLLVSMDYDLDPNPEKVKRFIDRKKLQSKVLILAEANPTDWIDKIDTLVINPRSGKRKLIEGEMKDGELDKLIETLK